MSIFVYFFNIWSNYKIGETMFKKITLFFSLTIILAILSISKEKTELVYNEIINDSEYRQIYLVFENNILNTNNFEDYLKDIEVLKVYPYINPVYAGRIKANYNYLFTHNNHQYDLEKFKNNYIEKLRSVGLISEANEYQVKGVIIKKVLIYSSLDEIKKTINNDNVKYTIRTYQ